MSDGRDTHRYVEQMAAFGRREAARRWNVERHPEGGLRVCFGHHDKTAPCEWVRYVEDRVAAQPDAYERGRQDERERCARIVEKYKSRCEEAIAAAESDTALAAMRAAWRECEAIEAAIRAGEEESADDWQPIETAPGELRNVARGFERALNPPRFAAFMYADDAYAVIFFDREKHRVTHWQRLHAPPGYSAADGSSS